MSSTYRIALIPGDGIGPEVTSAARRVVDATGVRYIAESPGSAPQTFDEERALAQMDGDPQLLREASPHACDPDGIRGARRRMTTTPADRDLRPDQCSERGWVSLQAVPMQSKKTPQRHGDA
jgi:hypothetical protein